MKCQQNLGSGCRACGTGVSGYGGAAWCRGGGAARCRRRLCRCVPGVPVGCWLTSRWRGKRPRCPAGGCDRGGGLVWVAVTPGGDAFVEAEGGTFVSSFRDGGLAVQDVDGVVIGDALLADQVADNAGGGSVIDKGQDGGSGTHGWKSSTSGLRKDVARCHPSGSCGVERCTTNC